MSAKNCHTCKHLEYESGDEWGSGSGWYCEKREPRTVEEENKMLKNFDSQAYRLRYKRCFEPKAATQTTEGANK